MDKICTKCGECKPKEEFNWKVKDKYRSSVCKKCHSIYRKEHYQNNKQKYIDKARRWELENKDKAAEARLAYRARQYGISVEEFRRLDEEQKGRCAICPNPHQAIDHCHKSSLVRGLLCRSCNTGLGFFKDDVVLLQGAIEYLTKT